MKNFCEEMSDKAVMTDHSEGVDLVAQAIHGMGQLIHRSKGYMEIGPDFDQLELWQQDEFRDYARGAIAALSSPSYAQSPWPADAQFQLGDHVTTPREPFWEGRVCGWYRNSDGRLGFNVEAFAIRLAVHNYPQTGLRLSTKDQG